VRMFRPFTLALCTTCTSYYPASMLATKKHSYVAGITSSMRVEYWAPDSVFKTEAGDRRKSVASAPQSLFRWPDMRGSSLLDRRERTSSAASSVSHSSAGPSTNVGIGDGGIVENFPLINLIARGDRCLVVFGNFFTDIDFSYDGTRFTVPEPAPVELDPASFFFDLGNRKDLDNFNYRHNVIFPKEDWPRLLRAWKNMRAKGKALIATLKHTTVANEYWSIPAGREVFVTWVYNSRNEKFLQHYFRNKTEADITLAKWKSVFKLPFPLGSTAAMLDSIPPEMVRLIYLHATMLVHDNQATFRRAVECKMTEEPW